MKKYLAVFHRMWSSGPARVFDHWFEEFDCEPLDLKAKLVELMKNIPRKYESRTSWTSLTDPVLVQVIKLE